MLLRSGFGIERETERETGEDVDASEGGMHRVLIHNDDVTPYTFVVAILMRIFELTPLIAEHVTYTAHTKGIALVAVLPRSMAERRVGKAHFAARLEGYPLRFTLEPDD